MTLVILPKYVLLMLVLPPQYLENQMNFSPISIIVSLYYIILYYSTFIVSVTLALLLHQTIQLTNYPLKVQHTPKPWAHVPGNDYNHWLHYSHYNHQKMILP